MQLFHSIETYLFGTSKDLVRGKEITKCNNMIKRYNNTKMNNFHDVTKENIKEQKPNWPQIPDHPYRTLITEGFGSGKVIHYLI